MACLDKVERLQSWRISTGEINMTKDEEIEKLWAERVASGDWIRVDSKHLAYLAECKGMNEEDKEAFKLSMREMLKSDERGL